jgi:signal transduction histidine kinase
MKTDRGLWGVVALILLAVLVPTACILYFMNEAIDNQRDVARQKLAEAYRGQLRNMADRIEDSWTTRMADIDRIAASPEAHFEQATKRHLADSIIVLGEDGAPAYPAPPTAPGRDPAAARPEWQAARGLEDAGRLAEAAAAWGRIAESESDANLAGRALQAEVRCVVTGHGSGLAALLAKFRAAPFARARDLQGRLIAADELVLTIRQLRAGDQERLAAAEALHRMAADYEKVDMPSGQRLFLMEELRSTQAGAGTEDFATYGAERLAAEYMEAGRVRAGDDSLRLSDVPGVWKISTPSHRAIALYREDTAIALMPMPFDVSMGAGLPQGYVFTVGPPGSMGSHDIVVLGGKRLPGWQFGLDMGSSRESAEVSRRRRISYLWVAILVIVTLTVTALAAGRIFLRQMRLTRLKTDLVATVSHELKTPLAGMRLLVDTLLDDPENDPAKTREYLQLIARENARLSRLIDNFLTFSRMERNRAQFEFARTEPEAVVQAALESVGDRFAVEVSIEPGVPAIQADADAIVTVLLNLLDNAFKYSVEPRHIELQVRAEGGRCCFVLSDNGIGIPARQRKKIFRRFYQVDQRLTRRPGGVGLGLSIVEFIVKAHGGSVRVESQPGSGSRFVVSLPGIAGAQQAAA